MAQETIQTLLRKSGAFFEEKGVDEADFMKNDAEFIYVLTADGNDGEGKPVGYSPADRGGPRRCPGYP